MSELLVVGIIPARMGSSRFPGKPLAEICGIPMLGHVWRRCIESKALQGLYVATCDEEIFKYIKKIGGKAIMTSSVHERASDRCAEALIEVEAELGRKVDIVVMIQGDEPLTNPRMIDQSLIPFYSEPDVKVTNLVGEIKSAEEFNSPNCIKVVVDKAGNAIYFSRSAIPFYKKWEIGTRASKQVCIIPFRREYLLKFSSLAPVRSEILESIDMLRFLENDIKVRMVPTEFEIAAVDTPSDLQRVEQIMKHDQLFLSYKDDRSLV